MWRYDSIILALKKSAVSSIGLASTSHVLPIVVAVVAFEAILLAIIQGLPEPFVAEVAVPAPVVVE